MLPKLDALKPGAWLGWQCATLEPCFMPSRAKPTRPHRSPPLARADSVLVLFGLNALICAPLYRVEYLDQMSSVEGVFIALARYMRDHAGDLYWCPLWFGGMPFQNTIRRCCMRWWRWYRPPSAFRRR